MQEEQTVSFTPSYEGHFPWFASLFAIYLLFVLLMTVVRAALLVWNLRKHRKAQQQELSITSSSQIFLEICNAKVRSIRNFSHLTFLLSVLVLVWNATDMMAMIATQKTSGFGAVAGALSEAFATFGAGTIVCIVLFCCAMFFERLVLRQRHMLDREGTLPSE